MIYKANYRKYMEEKNERIKQKIKERHSRLNFKEKDNKRYVQCQQCARWVLCHHPTRQPQTAGEMRTIFDIVPLYNFGDSGLLCCGDCFSKYYSDKYTTTTTKKE